MHVLFMVLLVGNSIYNLDKSIVIHGLWQKILSSSALSICVHINSTSFIEDPYPLAFIGLQFIGDPVPIKYNW